MHNNFIDKNRRYINLRQAEVKGVLPEYFQQSFPQFITLLEKYYDWQESESLTAELDNPAELLHHIFASRDITETDITLLSFIEDELLLGDAYFEGFGQTEAELRAAANFSNILFRSKGTKFAIEWFFRSFYGVDAEVTYPKEDIFNVGEAGSQIGPQANKYITNDKIYQTWALLLKTSIPITRWREIFKLFAHPAGMYLAGDVVLTGEYEAPLVGVGLDSAVTERTTPTYSLALSPDNEEPEGSVFTFTLTANNLPEDAGIAYFYVDDTGTATDSDFLVAIPDSSDPQPFSISGGTGQFTITTRRDSDETEGDETFTVQVMDDEFRSIGSSTLTINDVISQYTLSVDAETKAEGETFEFTVTGTTGTTPQGDHLLEYYVTHGTTIDSDFVGIVPSTGSPASVNISDDSGRFSLRARIDGVNPEADDTFTVSIRTPQNVVKDTSNTLTITDVAPTFTLTSPVSLIEGDSDIFVDLVVDDTTVGSTVNWTIDSDLNGRLPTTSGSFTITSTNMENIFLTQTVGNNTHEDLTKSLALINVTTADGEFSADAVTRVDNQAATYAITTTPSGAKEGDTVDVLVTTTNAPAGTYYYFIEDIDTVNATDFASTPPLSGTRASFAHGGATQSTTISSAFTYTDSSDTDEDYRLYLSDQGPSGGSTLTSEVQTIGDAATVYTLTAGTDPANEGDTVTMTFTTTGADGTFYYFVGNYLTGSGITADDFDAGYAPIGARQDFTTTSGSATFDLVLSEDLSTEGPETVNVIVSRTASGGSIVNETFVVNDTSNALAQYTVGVTGIVSGSAGIVKETNDIQITKTSATGVYDTPLYIEITDIIPERLTATQLVRNITPSEIAAANAAGTGIASTISPTLASSIYYGDSTGTVTIGVNNYVSAGGANVGSTTFTFKDADPLYTLTSNVASADEGDTVTFTFDGNNVPSGNYTHHNDAIKGKLLNAAVSGGDTRIFLNNTTGLQIGMESFSELTTGVSGSITNVGTTFVDMDTAVPLVDVTYGSTGDKIYFGFQEDRDDTTEFITSFTMTTGSPETEVFDVTFDADADAGTETITWGVYDDDENLLVSRSVDISGTDPLVDVPDGTSQSFPYQIDTTLALPVVQASIQFRPDGDIYKTGFISQALEDTGDDWIDDPANLSFDGSNFEIQATLITETGVGVITGQFGVWNDLGSNQAWTAEVANDDGVFVIVILIQIREIGNASNSDSFYVKLYAEEFFTGIGDGGTR